MLRRAVLADSINFQSSFILFFIKLFYFCYQGINVFRCVCDSEQTVFFFVYMVGVLTELDLHSTNMKLVQNSSILKHNL